MVRVVDGDTIRVLIDGVEYPLRYIGIDTPETVDPNSPVMWMGPEASAANEQLVEGQTVFLEKDISETDRFGRLLRYVWLDQPSGWLLVNVELVRQGFAVSSAYPPDIYQSLFDAAQEAARTADLGLWGASPTLAPTPTPAVARAHPRPTATRATRASASRRTRLISTAGTSPTAASRCCRLIPTASTATTTALGAKADEHQRSLQRLHRAP